MVPSSFRIARQLINRLEDVDSGKILPQAFHCDIPAERLHRRRMRQPSSARP